MPSRARITFASSCKRSQLDACCDLDLSQACELVRTTAHASDPSEATKTRIPSRTNSEDYLLRTPEMEPVSVIVLFDDKHNVHSRQTSGGLSTSAASTASIELYSLKSTSPLDRDCLDVEVVEHIHCGSLWDVYEARMRIKGAHSNESHWRTVVAKFSTPDYDRYMGAANRIEGLENAIVNEDIIYSEMLCDLQGNHIPEYYGLYRIMEDSSDQVGLYMMLMEKVQPLLELDDSLWEMPEYQK